MDSQNEKAVAEIVRSMETAWNAADGSGFARPFAADADFVNIRGEHLRSREAIAAGHQAIFDTIYKGSTVRLKLMALRALTDDVLLAHVRSTLTAPTGPLAGTNNSTFSLVLVRNPGGWNIAALHNTLVADRAEQRQA